MEELPVECVQLILKFIGRHQTLRAVCSMVKNAFDETPWLISIATVYNLQSFRRIYASCDTIILFCSKWKHDVPLLNQERNVIVPVKRIEGRLFQDDNAIQTLRYRDNRAINDDFSMMPTLTSLELSSNFVTDAVFKKMPNLKELKITNVERTDLKVLPKLETLSLQVFNLRHIPQIQPGLLSLTTRFYDVYGNAPVFASLTYLDVRASRLDCHDSEFDQLRCLKHLYMDDARFLTENALTNVTGLEVLHTKSGKVACSAVGGLKQLVIRNLEFRETFHPSAKLKAKSVELVIFHRLEIPPKLFTATKVESIYMVCCEPKTPILCNVTTVRHCKGMRFGVFSDYDCDCSRSVNFP
jgi:hypothetical protein